MKSSVKVTAVLFRLQLMLIRLNMEPFEVYPSFAKASQNFALVDQVSFYFGFPHLLQLIFFYNFSVMLLLLYYFYYHHYTNLIISVQNLPFPPPPFFPEIICVRQGLSFLEVQKTLSIKLSVPVFFRQTLAISFLSQRFCSLSAFCFFIKPILEIDFFPENIIRWFSFIYIKLFIIFTHDFLKSLLLNPLVYS